MLLNKDRKKMKKTYFTPDMETVELKLSGMLCVSGIPGSEEGGEDGGTTPVEVDPNDPGWSDKF
jgi:hypothetical protein